MAWGSPLMPKMGRKIKLGPHPPMTEAPSGQLKEPRAVVQSRMNKRAYKRFTDQPRFPNALLLFGKEQNTKVPM